MFIRIMHFRFGGDYYGSYLNAETELNQKLPVEDKDCCGRRCYHVSEGGAAV